MYLTKSEAGNICTYKQKNFKGTVGQCLYMNKRYNMHRQGSLEDIQSSQHDPMKLTSGADFQKMDLQKKLKNQRN